MPLTKYCSRCKTEKSTGNFAKSTRARDGLQAYCTDCSVAIVRQWRADHPESVIRHDLVRHGLTLTSYRALLATQGDRCAICGSEEPGKGNRFHVDHDHTCCVGSKSCGNCIRGLLCNRCNRAMGMFEDNPDLLYAAWRYLLASHCR